MQPKLCAAGVQLRDQVDTWFPDRRTASDGWVGDSRHSARKSDHNPDEFGYVRAIDIDSGLEPSDGKAPSRPMRTTAGWPGSRSTTTATSDWPTA